MSTDQTLIAIDNGWITNAKKCISKHYNARPNDQLISLLVIHNISLPPGQFGGEFIEQFFTGMLNTSIHPFFKEIEHLSVSAHCLIDRQGFITQFVSFDERAWHAGRSSFKGQSECNDFSIGIELEGTDDIPYTCAQYKSLVTLTKALQNAYPLISDDRIAGHNDIAPNRKTDPGPSFDWVYYLDQLRKV